MSTQTLPPSLRNILADILEMTPDEITIELNATEAGSWDSFRHLQLLLAVEEEYRVQFDPQRIPDLTSVSSLLQELGAKGVSF